MQTLLTFIPFVSILLSIGAVIVSVTTQINHVKHIAEKVDEIKVRITAFEEKLNKTSADLEASQAVCNERHK